MYVMNVKILFLDTSDKSSAAQKWLKFTKFDSLNVGSSRPSLGKTEEPTSSIVTSMAGYHGTLVAQAIQVIV